METRRAESFSDGVFAVAITVLVFNLLPIAVPRITVHTLVNMGWPQYVAYVVSFLTIGIMWLNHHTMLSHLGRVDRPMLVLNLLLLLNVVAVPFTTALVAQNLGAGSPESAKLATVAYGLVMITMSIAFSGMWMYLSSHQERLEASPIRTPRQAQVRFSAGLVGYVAGTLVAFFWPVAALAIYGVIAVYYLFEHLPEPAADAEPGQEGSAGP